MSHWARRRCSRIPHGEWGKPFGRVPRRAGGKSFTAASKSTWAWSLWRSSVTRCSRSALSLLMQFLVSLPDPANRPDPLLVEWRRRDPQQRTDRCQEVLVIVDIGALAGLDVVTPEHREDPIVV